MTDMRDVFEDLFGDSPADPTEAARRTMRPLRRRFYTEVGLGEAEEGVAVLLDGRQVRTPARRRLALPNAALAARVAQEWRGQAEFVDPAAMPTTRLANVVIDAVVERPAEVADDIARYLGSDLVCYRAEGPDRLVARQHALWDPILDWAREAHRARFVLAAGVTYVKQPETALAAMRATIPADPWRLGATHVITALTGSALLALALAERAVTLEEAWAAANLDEDWNMELWGHDDLALAARAAKRLDMDAAAAVLDLVPASPGAPGRTG